MYKFRALPVLEGRAAEYFYDLQEKMANAEPGFDVKAAGEGMTQCIARGKADRAKRMKEKKRV